MSALNNPKHEIVAQAFLEKPIAKEAYKEAYPNVSDSAAETIGPRLLRNDQVRNRIQELLEQKGLSDDYLLTFGRDNFLHNEDANIGLKAWRTFLEIKGIINNEQGVSIANIVFNEQIVQPQAVPEVCQPQDVVGQGTQ